MITSRRGHDHVRSRFILFRAVVSRREKMLEESLGTIEKVAGDEKVFRLLITDLPDRVPVEIKEDRARVGKENRRVRRDDELRVPGRREIVDDPEKTPSH
jgi:hypothetical protein